MDLRPKDIYIVLEYLRRGGKVKMDGRTYVWLDNHVVRETEGQKWVIDGLATETRSYGPGEDWKDPNAGSPYYMGCKDMPFPVFISRVNNMDFAEFTRIAQELRAQFDVENKTHI